jgi:hypothetical protein
MTISKHRSETYKNSSLITRHGSEGSIELLRRSRLGLTAHSAPADCSVASAGPLKSIEQEIEDALERLTQHTGSEIEIRPHMRGSDMPAGGSITRMGAVGRSNP